MIVDDSENIQLVEIVRAWWRRQKNEDWGYPVPLYVRSRVLSTAVRRVVQANDMIERVDGHREGSLANFQVEFEYFYTCSNTVRVL